ncbi:MAG TPA: cysteine synthase [Clostridiales bacterium]|nr:cysteine synthase [Clostridiales bacterium]
MYETLFAQYAAFTGNTPLLEMRFSYQQIEYRIFAKDERYNYSGSIKDRVALHILLHGYEQGLLNKDDVIIEATSGNMGIAFSAFGTLLGHRVMIYMPDWMSRERISLMESYGAEVKLVSREEGGFLGCIALTEEKGKQPGYFLPRQFSNPQNTRTHYLTTGPEIERQLGTLGLTSDAVVAGVGTGGTIMGIGTYLREKNQNCKVHPLEPLNSPTLSTGFKIGAHRIQGISDDFIPEILKLKEIDAVVSVDDSDAIGMARKLASKLGLGVGISAGANFIGAVMLALQYGQDANIVTVFPDDNKKYLSTDYSLEPILTENSLVPQIELKSVRAYR